MSQENKKMPLRVRIAPSPTGFFHIGTARTALFNFLFARSQRGKFILRIEDTDKKRSDKRFEKDIIEGLDWLGLKRDEGPVVGGAYGPYRQSERGALYQKYLKQLLREGKAFYCFCGEHGKDTEEENTEETQKERHARQIHWCQDRDLSSTEAEARLQRGEPYIIRFKTPQHKIVKFYDLIRGEVKVNTDILGDFSLAKSRKEPLYNFAVVVDDYEMRISHVIRGEDHISNTPKQILLQEALGFYHPQYVHLPLILGPDKSKLSKRHNAVSLREYRRLGYLPEALVNFMALLGWNPGTDEEIFSLAQLVKIFSLKRVQSAGAVFNVNKLDWLNGYYLRKMPIEELTRAVSPYLKKIHISREKLREILIVSRDRLRKISDFPKITKFFFEEPSFDPQLLFWKKMTKKEVEISLKKSLLLFEKLKPEQFRKKELGKILLKEADSINSQDKGFLLWPLRVALTGLSASPSPFEVSAILGKEESIKRIKKAIAQITSLK